MSVSDRVSVRSELSASSQIPVDDTSDFGSRKPSAVTAGLISLTQNLGLSWFGKRLTYAFRRIGLLMMGECADVILFGARLRIYPHNNVSEKRVLFATQLFDPAEREALRALAAPGAVFLDIGANVGLYSISVGEAFAAYADTRIIAVEPHPYIYRRLAFNAALNPTYNITAVEAGIADHEGTLSLTLHGDNLGETRMVQADITGSLDNPADAVATDKVMEVPVISLMQLVEAQGLTRIDGMKVDVEGFEEKVILPFFDAAPDALLPRVIIIENNVRHWDVDIVAVAATRSYASHRISKNNLMLSRDPS